MNRIIGLTAFFFILISTAGIAQSELEQNAKPILMDRSVLSGVGLDKIDLKDEPDKDFYQKRLYRGESISVYVVSTETWNNDITNYPFDEYVYLIHGQSIVKPKKGNATVFDSGDHLFMPKGFVGEWEIRAGNNLHYELSVITSKRDSNRISENLACHSFDKSTLSGGQINFENGTYNEVLRKGVDLTISLLAEQPVSKSKIFDNECLIHILSGQLTVRDMDDAEQTFYTGDFIVFPVGKYKEWESKGHGLMKYLLVERTR